MRIIAGSLRGRRLNRLAPGIRPTSDRLREALFACLGNRVAGSVWMDAFGGSGAIGLEALSRGAEYVYFNDRVRKSAELIRRNLETCQVRSGFSISRQDALQFLREAKPRPVDFIYLDPPYHEGLEPQLLEAVKSNPVLLRTATILLEHFKKTPVVLPHSDWEIVRTLKAGDSLIEIISPTVPKGA